MAYFSGITDALRWWLCVVVWVGGRSSALTAMGPGPLDLHLWVSQPMGAPVYDAHVGPGWTYSMDRHRSAFPATSLFDLDLQQGQIVLRRSPDCSRIAHNPFSVFIESRHESDSGDANYTVTPLTVYIHGVGCDIRYPSSNHPHTRGSILGKLPPAFKSRAVLRVSIQLEVEYGGCLGAQYPVLALSQYLPSSVVYGTSPCELLYLPATPPSDIVVDSLTGDLSTVSQICIFWTHYSMQVALQSICGSQASVGREIILDVILYPKDDNSFVHFDGFELAQSLQKPRSRRGAPNIPPVFAKSSFKSDVPEEEPAGYIIDTFTATDSDQGDSGRITYSLLATRDGRSQKMFAIDATSGQLTTTQILDRETMSLHYFQVIAVDHGQRPQTAYASLTIQVTDANDHAPVFENEVYIHEISERTGMGAQVLTLRARDADFASNAEIEYTILNPDPPNDDFKIDSQYGIISARRQLDRERTNFYRLVIQASDRALLTERKTATAIVEITVLDVNDNRPQFSQSSYTVDVREDIDPSNSPVIAEIQATDKDAGPNGVVQYSITGGNSYQTFAIDAITGQISLLKSLDYEQNSRYILNIRAQDNGSPYKSNSTTVLVRVVDVNDNDPKFFSSKYQESVLENEPEGYTITRVQAHDADHGKNSELSYSIINAAEDMPIVVDAQTGVLSLSAPLDREHTERYSFRVEARDHGELARTATASVEVNVRDINDNAPIFEPKVYYEVVSEEARLGTLVVAITAKDPDENARITYTIEDGNINNAFSIDSHMGQGLIRVFRMLDYQHQNRYILSVKASDDHLTDMGTVFINISDANTFRPIFQGTPYQVRVSEDKPSGSSVFTVHATDGDDGENARIMYTMSENDAFQVDPNTGEITIKHPLDREKTAVYTVSVTASDHGRPQKTDNTDVEIIIIDVNDNAPKFSSPVYNGRVAEDAFVGTSILVISAADEDEGLNGMIRYTFENGNSGDGDFMLDPTLGILRTAKELDREKVSDYELRAFAVDRGAGNSERSTSVMINVDVEDVNDNAPQFETTKIDLYIRENSPIGSTVDKIEAVDPDDGVNAKVEYSIVGGTDADSFSLITRQNEAAVITTLVELDYESEKKEYTIVVRARSFHLFSDATVTIHVKDENDNVPQLEDFVIVFNNYRDNFPSEEIGRIPAYDPDEYDELKYKFISGNQANILHLSPHTGRISLDSRLNSDVATNATLQVSVSDGINEVKRTCHLYVRLVSEAMLTNSTTVRLHNIDTAAFLTLPLYNMFTSALASIVPTTQDNIFIINIQDDTEVSERILNVSFAVREKVDSSLHDDVFYPPQFVQEKVYLQRALLAKLSTLEVLPFDDNLCLMEPCPNFEECLVIQGFGNATSFLSSATMLFRPIHPTKHFRCECPTGFSGMKEGYTCDVEVNLCYSNPCGGNGTCHQREGGYTCICHHGYTGANCELDMQTTRHTTCPRGVCRHGARCVPLIRGGFRCEQCSVDGAAVCTDCREVAHHTAFCELTTRSFPKGSFLMFPSLKRRHRFHIQLQFATRGRDALLFYNGRYNELHDFMALELVDGNLQFSFSLGSEVTRVTAGLPTGVTDGNWHQVAVYYFNGSATLTVGEFCDTRLSVLHGARLNNYSCAAQATLVLDEKCEDPTSICHRFLDLTGPFQLGGLPALPTHFQVHNSDFSGCIRNLRIDDLFIDLNAHVYNNRTQPGCQQKKSFCQSEPCQNGGVCEEVWNSYRCRCPHEYGGKDCSHTIERPRRLLGNSVLKYADHGLGTIQLPWYNTMTFRTRQNTALLMSIEVGEDRINIEMVKGLLHYIHPKKTIVLDGILVNDGKWHHLETRWITQQFIFTLDYGQFKKLVPMDDWVTGQVVGVIYVGGLQEGSEVINGLRGCVKNMRVGKNPDSPNSLLRRPSSRNVLFNCEVGDACADSPCPSNSYCNDEWEQHSCTCMPGRVGLNCELICDHYNPCAGGAPCKQVAASSDGYTCECGHNSTGQYCERPLHQECPASWWGSPICGPCNCPVHRGFNANCNKTNGECYCREHHYRPAGSDTCFPCECFAKGSHNATCNAATGQCHCKEGVIGRRCDGCTSKYAEVTSMGCKVIYDACPEGFAEGILWLRTNGHNRTVMQDCPPGAVGKATRHCGTAEESWWAPDISECLTHHYGALSDQLVKLELGVLKMNAYVAKHTISELRSATSHTDTFYLMDVNVTSGLLTRVLDWENSQSGLNLTHTQDRNFIQNIVATVSQVLSSDTQRWWHTINPLSKQQGAGSLLEKMEAYSVTLAQNMHRLHMKPTDYVAPNLVFGMDYTMIGNYSNITVPKYNNKVRNPAMFDNDTHIVMPTAVLKAKSMHQKAAENSVLGKENTDPVITYMIFKTLGFLMPDSFGSDVVRQSNVTVAVNSPVLTLNVLSGGEIVKETPDAEPLEVHFKQLEAANRTSPQCVYWQAGEDGSLGRWSTAGCRSVEELSASGGKYVSCQCDHMSAYAVLMYISSQEYQVGRAVRLEIVTYVGLSISLLCLLVAFVLFCCLRSHTSNAISIHINLVFCIFVVHLLFLVGINQTQVKIACKVVAISLHYFYMCTFTWMFVETLHLYRRMTEIRNINQGTMKFYFVLGYVIPGIIVGLAVGLDTEKYGNPNFCWLRTSDLLIWSFAGPVCCAVGVNIIVLIMALKASCQSKKGDPDFSYLKYGVRAAMVLLPLLGVAWVFGLLSVNDDVIAFHYLFAVFNCLQGIFILMAYVLFSKETRRQLRYKWYSIKGKQKLDESLNGTRASMLNRSALAYHQDSPIDGTISRLNIGVSTNSTTSRSTSKSSGALYKDPYLQTTSSSTSGNVPSGLDYPPNAGIPPYGFDPSIYHEKKKNDPDTGEIRRKRQDSDSDSEMSAIEHPDMELASSHSSDDDDEHYEWGKVPKKGSGRFSRPLKVRNAKGHTNPLHHGHPLNLPNGRIPSPAPSHTNSPRVAFQLPPGHRPSSTSPINYKGALRAPTTSPASPQREPLSVMTQAVPASGERMLSPGGLSPQHSTPSPPATGPPSIPPRPPGLQPPHIHRSPTHSTPALYMRSPCGRWPGEGYSSNTTSDGIDIKTPNKLIIHDKMPADLSYKDHDLILPPERSDSLLPQPGGGGGRGDSPHSPAPSPSPHKDNIHTLTHNGSITESESGSLGLSDTTGSNGSWA